MKLTNRYIGRATDQHRKPRPPIPGAVVGQRFVDCATCGVSTAATVHGDLVRCTEGHVVPTGGA